jgi:hypothetical protein
MRQQTSHIPQDEPQHKTFSATASGASVETETESAGVHSGEHDHPPLSDARLNANRANAQHSSGPRSETGKAKSSLNALKTGLTGQTVVLPTDDLAAYQAHLNRHFAKYSPATDDEHTLVQSIADTEFRLLRIAPLEAGIFSLGHREFANDFADETNPATRAGLIQAKIAIHYRRDLNNLAIQERRLRNHREKDIAKLEGLQQSRRNARKYQIDLYKTCLEQDRPFNPADAGFDFSVDEIQTYLRRSATQYKLALTRPDFDSFLTTYRKEQCGAGPCPASPAKAA